MKAILGSVIFIFSALIACHKTTLPPNENLPALNDRFHGQYKPISSTSSEAIDVNLDGIASKDMLGEIQGLIDAKLEIRIYENQTPLFTQFWQEQYFGSGIPPIIYDSTIVINYATQGFTRLFKFDSEIKQINLYPDNAPMPDSIHFPFPKSVTIEANDRIKVISAKQLLTLFGWKNVEITTIYERYTRVT